ncbi:MAG: polysaccharide pyruvyl transferase CsaB, partial [Negativicutes bacterium]|nr:polysaccharide pyruvyl transferase CsaB [Negativicutes bacterium]
PKIDRFLETLGERHIGTLQNVTVDAVMQRIAALWPEIQRPSPRREERISILRDKAFYNAELAFSLIESRERR